MQLPEVQYGPYGFIAELVKKGSATSVKILRSQVQEEKVKLSPAVQAAILSFTKSLSE